MPGKNWKVQTRLLVREGAPQPTRNRKKKKIKERMGKIGRRSQVGAWHQDGLADWLSVVI
jgi:IS30 family transposase